ncbi:DNA-directed RNA polymerase I subunit RPA49-like protein, partial [Euroglyphus maynei]
KPENCENFVYWPASQPPPDPEFKFEKFQNQTKLLAKDTISFESFNDKTNDDFNYFAATIDPNNSGRLICRPAKLYRMLPNYEFKDLQDAQNADDENVRLTKREQMDELKRKFGSKKSQRDLASKRKYEIHFGEDDAENLPTLNNNNNDDDDKNPIKDEDANEQQSSMMSTIMPERNAMAKNVTEVYKLSDIIFESEERSIMEFERELFELIKNDYLKELCTKNNQKQYRLMAIYADILLQLLSLSAYQMRKADPLPLIVGDIKKFIFDRYTSTKNVSTRQQQYVLTDQNKDRLLIHVFILIIMLNNYRPIYLEKMQKYCSVKMSHLRRIFELIGCYIENSRSLSGLVEKVACFRLPLNVYKEPMKLKRLKGLQNK